jgi:hypothetical protein
VLADVPGVRPHPREPNGLPPICKGAVRTHRLGSNMMVPRSNPTLSLTAVAGGGNLSAWNAGRGSELPHYRR